MSRVGTVDNRPVDSFVRSIRYVLDDFQDICTGSMDSVTVALKLEAGFSDTDPCRTKDFFADTNGFKGQPGAGLHNFTDYRGQEKHCCDSVKSCYNSVDQTLINVRLAGALKQNMHQACRRIDEELNTVNTCVETKLGLCYKIDTRDLRDDFEDFKQKFKEEFDKHCDSLPPETLHTTSLTTDTTETTKTSTHLTASTESTRATTYVTTEAPNTSISTTGRSVLSTKQDTTSSSTSTVNPNHVSTHEDKSVYPNITVPDSDVSTVTTAGPDKHSTASTPSTAITNVTEPTMTDPTTGASFSTSTFTTTPPTGVSHPPSDNTVVIVSAVCCGILVLIAVLVFLVLRMRRKGLLEKCDGSSCTKGLPCKLFQRDKPPPGPQDEIYTEIDDKFMQAVYEFDKKKDPHPNLKNRVQTNAHVNVCYSSADDGLITSTKSRGPTLQLGTRNLRQIPKQNTYLTSNQMKGSLEKSIKNDFVFSHPTFTDPRGTDTVPDEYVQISEKYDYIEPVYDQPQHHNKKISDDSERNYADRNEYDHIVAHQTDQVYSEPDYINSGVTQNNDRLYENEKIGNYEIKQSRF